MSRDAFKLDVVSIRLVRDAPIYSDQKLNSPQAAVHLVGGRSFCECWHPL